MSNPQTVCVEDYRPKTASRRSSGLVRLGQVLSLILLSVALLAAKDPNARFDHLGHQMVCPCSCSEVLLECNHVGCPDSHRMIGELRDQLDGPGGSGTDLSILTWFSAKYGATVLASPIRGGFDNVAWIMPFAVLFLATIGAAVLLRTWKLRSQVPAPALARTSANDDILDRIRRETQY